MLDAILSEEHDFFAAPPGCSVCLLVNNLGTVPALELYIVARAALKLLQARQVGLQSAPATG